MDKIKVLWFEVSVPGRYSEKDKPIAGWQDSLECIVRSMPDVELYIAFETSSDSEVRIIDRVTYIPIYIKYSLIERISNHFAWSNKKIVAESLKIISKYSPDIIHVFGTEWPFGLVAKYTNIPLIVHIQGAIIPYNNSMFPPCYSYLDRIQHSGFNLVKQGYCYVIKKKALSREKMEREIWDCVVYYMGRTGWDRAVSEILHPGRLYFHVDEALRKVFIENAGKWEVPNNIHYKLLSIGCSSFWKGPDMLLKVAILLKKRNIDFEWRIAGVIPKDIKQIVEEKEKASFEDNNVSFLGFVPPNELLGLMLDSNIYIHTAYIENSPNSICEAQILGMPIVSTNVGGISSLIENHKSGILVPANDPWQMAYYILNVLKDEKTQKLLSKNGQLQANQRHNPSKIYNDLLNTYKSIINEK